MNGSRLMFLTAMTLVIGVIGATTAAAQGLPMSLKPDTKLVLSGSSNVHDWSCSSSAFTAVVDVDADLVTRPLNEVKRPINKVAVTIPVITLKCGNKKMDKNMYAALNEGQFKDIQYTQTSYTIDATTATADTIVVTTIGDLTVGGKTVKVQIPIKTERLPGGVLRGIGSINLKMTDFGIKPPVALLGTLRTRDAISISFNVLLDRSVVVATSPF